MSFERSIAGPGAGAEVAPTPSPSEPGSAVSPATTMRLQILSAEHWSLLASRSLAWNKSFSRGGLFLATMSGSIVALALVAQASSFGSEFRLFALAILPLVLFVGITTFVRMGASNYHDALCIVGMNRIRAAYLELAPDLARYFVMSAHDDVRGISASAGGMPGPPSVLDFVSGTPTVVGILNSVLTGVVGALLIVQLGAGAGMAVVVGALGFLVATAGQAFYVVRSLKRATAGYHPIFPTPQGE